MELICPFAHMSFLIHKMTFNINCKICPFILLKAAVTKQKIKEEQMQISVIERTQQIELQEQVYILLVCM